MNIRHNESAAYNADMSSPIDSPAPPGIRLLTLLASLIERVLQQLLRLDPATTAALAPLEGRVIRLSLVGATRGLRLRIANGHARLMPDDASPPDLALSIAPDGWIEWLSRSGPDRGLPKGTRIEGDLELARLLERALSQFDPDWEQPFADVFGITAGPPLARHLAGVANWTRTQTMELVASAAEYVTEEARLVGTRGEIDAFNADVDAFRDDVERLDARITRLARGTGQP